MPVSFICPSSLDVLLDHYTNRLFALSGRFPPPTPENTVFLGPRVRDGVMGYHVIQPFDRDSGGGKVLVDRGFVPKDRIVHHDKDPSTWQLMDVSVCSSLYLLYLQNTYTFLMLGGI